MKKTKLFVLLTLIVSSVMIIGCKNSTFAQLRSLGTKHRVTLYSGGVAVGTWISTGNVSNQKSSDGYYFEDEATKKLIEISGTTIIEQL